MESRFAFLQAYPHFPANVMEHLQTAEHFVSTGFYKDAAVRVRNALEGLLGFYWTHLGLPEMGRGEKNRNPFYDADCRRPSDPRSWPELELGSILSRCFVLEQEGVWKRQHAELAHTIRLIGNDGSHDRREPVSREEIVKALDNLIILMRKWTEDFPTPESTLPPSTAFKQPENPFRQPESASAPRAAQQLARQYVAAAKAAPNIPAAFRPTPRVWLALAVVVLFVLLAFNLLSGSPKSGAPTAETPSAERNTLRYPNGDVFQGRVVNGKGNDSAGTITRADGTVCTGSVMDDRLHGEAACRHPDGSRYTGRFQNDVREGRGVLEWPLGRYEGGFAADLFSGEGVLVLSAGGGYTGGFAQGRPSGSGVLRLADGRECAGEFTAADADCRFADQSRYQGGYDEQLRFNGTGRLSDGAGVVLYEGFWLAGQPQGALRSAADAAAAALTARAEAGDAQAQFELAHQYAESGDHAAMVRWTGEAARAGHAQAQFHWAEWLLNGEYGQVRNREQAVIWYRRAAAQNHRGAAQKLAQIMEAEAAARGLEGKPNRQNDNPIDELF